MFAMTVFTGVMVSWIAAFGVCEIIRDLIQDCTKPAYDWFWDESWPVVFSIPTDMVFELPDNDPEFSIEVQSEDGEVKLYFGYNETEAVVQGAEFINITSLLHKEIDLEYLAESKHFRGALTRCPIS